MKNEKSVIQMKDISIEFPGVKALSNVDFEIEGGKIQALIGANGAGKSTLMKVLSGAYTHYTGEIFIDGIAQDIRSTSSAKDLGIEIVYQEVDTALIPNLNVAENIMLNSIIHGMGKKQFVKWSELHKRAQEVLAQLNMNIDTNTKISDLTLVEKQMVLIARAVSEECKFLILDEPTAPLSDNETEELFRIVRELAAQGVGIIFISHRLPELFLICENIAIMRDGEMVTKMAIDKTLTTKTIVELMLGQSFEETFNKKNVPIKEEFFTVKNLSDKEDTVKDVSLHLKKGEIIGIAGLVGAGKTELCKTLFGATKKQIGQVILNGNEIKVRSPYDAVKNGVVLVPEERRKEGVLVQESVCSNLSCPTLGNYSDKLGFIKFKEENQMAKKMVEDLGVKTPSIKQKVAFLSGGNQQKVAVGKWLVSDADVYIFDEATKGVDVAAKHDIFGLIDQLVEMGKGVIYASCEISEILAITDRVYVMYDGQIMKELVTSSTNEEEILYYSTGGQ